MALLINFAVFVLPTWAVQRWTGSKYESTPKERKAVKKPQHRGASTCTPRIAVNAARDKITKHDKPFGLVFGKEH